MTTMCEVVERTEHRLCNICDQHGTHSLTREWDVGLRNLFKDIPSMVNVVGKRVVYSLVCSECESIYSDSYLINLNARLASVTAIPDSYQSDIFRATEFDITDHILLPKKPDSNIVIDGRELLVFNIPDHHRYIDNQTETYLGKFLQIKENFPYLIDMPSDTILWWFKSNKVTLFDCIPLNK